MVPLKIENLYQYLVQNEFPVQIQKETQQVFMAFPSTGKQFPLFIRVFPGGNLLQLISFIPCKLKPEARAELARALHFLNKEVDLPGFGMDESAQLVFYRLMIPVEEQQISEKILTQLIKSIEHLLQNFVELITMVASGTSSFDQLKSQLELLKTVPSNGNGI